MTYDKTDKVIKERFEPLVSRYQIGLETSMSDCDFLFDYVHLLYCKCHTINLNCGGSNPDSPA